MMAPAIPSFHAITAILESVSLPTGPAGSQEEASLAGLGPVPTGEHPWLSPRRQGWRPEENYEGAEERTPWIPVEPGLPYEVTCDIRGAGGPSGAGLLGAVHFITGPEDCAWQPSPRLQGRVCLAGSRQSFCIRHLFPCCYGNRESGRLVSMWAALFLSGTTLAPLSEGGI